MAIYFKNHVRYFIPSNMYNIAIKVIRTERNSRTDTPSMFLFILKLLKLKETLEQPLISCPLLIEIKRSLFTCA